MITSPETIFKKKSGISTKYEPTVKGVNPIHIGLVVVGLFLVYHFFFNGIHGMSSIPAPAQVNPFVPTSPYPGWASFTGWKNVQYNQLGTNAGALRGESN